jgi:HMG (high mobility group) box
VDLSFINTQEPLVTSHDLLPDFHTPSFYTSPFDQSLYLPPSSPSRRSGNRVPRPRNAFMIFRNEFWAEAKISRSVEHDHRHISRIIGHCWNQLPDAEKNKWRQKAEQEKLEHIMKYPGYRFTPNARTKKVIKRKVKRNGEEELLRCKQVAELLLAGKHGVELDSAVKSMKSPPEGTALKETGPSTSGELQHESESSAGDVSAFDHFDIPVFRSPLLPPAEMSMNISPTYQTPSVSMILHSLGPG